MSRKSISFFHVIFAVFINSFALLILVSPSWANAPADATVVNLRTTCTEGGVQVPNCFTTMSDVDNWLRNVRQAGPTNPALVEIGPGTFGDWNCQSSNVTLRGAGRDRTILQETGSDAAITVDTNCTNLNVQDLTLDGSQALVYGGVRLVKLDAITAWTNVEIIGSRYAWIEDSLGGCQSHAGQHSFFSTRITAVGGGIGSTTIGYWATCATSWFWGSQITASVVAGSESNVRALLAIEAEVHLYGSNVRLILPSNVAAVPASGVQNGTALMSATSSSVIHIHGTGLDVDHAGTGRADVLYADSTSHFHANAAGFSIHVTGSGMVNRIDGVGIVEAPYIWGANVAPPLSTSQSGVQTLASRDGMDSFIETNCPLTTTTACSAGANLPPASQYPRLMVYRAECTGTGATQGPWFDTVQSSCRN
ncbi:MAG: hypothetical protein ACYC9J_15345 [Sulfuricaulis sp.]